MIWRRTTCSPHVQWQEESPDCGTEWRQRAKSFDSWAVFPLELRRSEAQSFWRVKDFPKYGSALALRINARQLFSGREPWFRLQARKLIGRRRSYPARKGS